MSSFLYVLRSIIGTSAFEWALLDDDDGDDLSVKLFSRLNRRRKCHFGFLNAIGKFL